MKYLCTLHRKIRYFFQSCLNATLTCNMYVEAVMEIWCYWLSPTTKHTTGECCVDFKVSTSPWRCFYCERWCWWSNFCHSSTQRFPQDIYIFLPHWLKPQKVFQHNNNKRVVYQKHPQKENDSSSTTQILQTARGSVFSFTYYLKILSCFPLL